MITFAVRRPISVIMIGLGLVVLGIISINKIPLNLMPAIKILDFAIVITSKGTSAEEIERTIVDPIERSIGTTPGIIKTSSVSQKDIGQIFIRFRSDIDIVETLSILKDRIEMVSMPEGASKPRIQRDQRNLEPIIRVVLSKKDETKNENEWIEELRNTLIRNLERVSGVAAVNIMGGPEKFVQIRLSPEKLRAYSIQPQSIINAINESSKFTSIGEIKLDKILMPIRIGNELKSMPDIESIVIRRDGPKTVRVKDVAEIELVEEKNISEVRNNGKSGIILEVRREPDANAVKTAKSVMEQLNSIDYTDAFAMSILSDQGEEIQLAIDNVFHSVRDGALLAGIIVFLLIQSGWPTFVINLAIPLSLLMTFVLMHFTGISFNLMSLAGLALGVGMLVDNSTVVLQSISLESQSIKDLMEAAIQGTKKVAAAITASTISTIAVFGPLAFVPGVIGQMFRDVAATVCYSILSSLVISLIFIPMLSAHQEKFIGKFKKATNTHLNLNDFLMPTNLGFLQFLIHKQKLVWLFIKNSNKLLLVKFDPIRKFLAIATKKIFGITNLFFGRLEAGLRSAIDLAFSKRKQYLLFSVLSVFLGLFILNQQGSQLFPEDPTDQLTYTIAFRPGTSPEKKSLLTSQLENRLKKIKDIQSVTSVYGIGPGIETQIFVRLNEVVKPKIIKEVSQVLTSLPEVIPNRKKASMVSEEKPIRVEFQSENLAKIDEAVKWTQMRLVQISELVDIQSSSRPASAEITIEFDKSRMNLLSLDANQFISPLKTYLKGAEAGAINLEGKSYTMKMQRDPASFRSLDSIQFYSIDNDEQKPIYLNQVAKFKDSRNASIIFRQEKKRIGFVVAEFSGTDLGLANEKIRKILEAEFPFKDVAFQLTGQEQERKANNQNLFIAIVLSILVIFLLLASQFESLSQPMVVLASVPFCILGMSLFIWAFGLQISVLVFVGFIILVGSSVNSSIVMVDYANDLILHGADPKEAIIKSTQRRMRPILVTTLSNVFGLVPMALAGAEKGSGLQQPIAVTILGGLVSSTALTLIVVPVLFVMATKIRKKGVQ